MGNRRDACLNAAWQAYCIILQRTLLVLLARMLSSTFSPLEIGMPGEMLERGTDLRDGISQRGERGAPGGMEKSGRA